MKLINKKMTLLFMGIAVVVLMGATECMCSFAFNDYTAQAVNIKAADSTDGFYKDSSSGTTLVGTTVSLYAYDAATGSYASESDYSTTVDSTGYFTFPSPVSNRYKLTATSADWIFVPQYIEITNSGASSTDLLAYPKSGAGEYTIVASWEKKDIDLDLTVTYGPADTAGLLDTAMWDGETKTTTERLRIFYSRRGSTNGTGISLDMDVTDDDAATISRVETISIHDATWFNPSDIVKVYIDTPYTDHVLTGYEGTAPSFTDAKPSAYAQVDLMYYNGLTGSSEEITHFGTWYIPWNTYESTIQVFEMLYTGSNYSISSANNAVTLNSTGTGYETGIKSIIRE